MKALLAAFFVILTVSCNGAEAKKAVRDADGDQKLILNVIDSLEESANKADPSIAGPHLLMDDDRFTEIEDFIPEPFGAEGLRKIHDWVRKNGKPGNHVRFTKRKVYLLSPTTAYATSIQELRFDKPSKSRVTFIFLKKDGRWRVIHGHYSTMPKPE